MNNSRYQIESGHRMCHPETCTCWNWRIWDNKQNRYVYNSDDRKDAELEYSLLIKEDTK